MTQLRKAMLEELQRRNLSPITTRIYLRAKRRAALQEGPGRDDGILWIARKSFCHARSVSLRNWSRNSSATERILPTRRHRRVTPRGARIQLHQFAMQPVQRLLARSQPSSA